MISRKNLIEWCNSTSYDRIIQIGGDPYSIYNMFASIVCTKRIGSSNMFLDNIYEAEIKQCFVKSWIFRHIFIDVTTNDNTPVKPNVFF